MTPVYTCPDGGITCFRALALNTVVPLVNSAVGILLAVSLVIFMWGIVRYIISAGSNEKSQGRDMMMWGIIALVVFSAIWGITAVVKNSLLSGNGASATPYTYDRSQGYFYNQ